MWFFLVQTTMLTSSMSSPRARICSPSRAVGIEKPTPRYVKPSQ
jgi:hypothetical protein